VRWQSILKLCVSVYFTCRFVSFISVSLFWGCFGVGMEIFSRYGMR